MMNTRSYRVGGSIEDYCRACKTDRIHTVMAADGDGRPIRVVCDYCRSEHNYRGGPRIDVEGGVAARPQPQRESRTMVTPRESATRPRSAAPSGDLLPLVSDRERIAPPMSVDSTADLELLLRRIIREETGLTPVTPADKWRDGVLVLRPGKPGLQEKTWPIEAFFHKVVMLRNRLRTLEQQLNASELPEDAKVKLQSYITGCYGSLTSFNVLFADEDDQFKGSGSD
jgi:hypothetical protein